MRFLIRSHTVPHTYEVAGLAYEVADLGERVGGEGASMPCRFIYVVYKSISSGNSSARGDRASFIKQIAQNAFWWTEWDPQPEVGCWREIARETERERARERASKRAREREREREKEKREIDRERV